MKISRRELIKVSAATAVLGTFSPAAEAVGDPLPSWNDGTPKKAVLEFVRATTEKSSPKYVEPKDRIATFDQDGTLWTEHPLYSQAMFALHRVGEMAPKHPEWKTTEPFKSVLTGDREGISKFSEKDWMEIVAVTHSGMGTEDFQALVKQWITTAKAPRFDRLYTELVFQPMLEVMKYLREKDFRTFIVTGGGQEFVRVYSERVYGVPPEQVVGSSIVTKYDYVNGKPVLMREPKPFFIDDGPGKAIGINMFIGKRPYAAFGNTAGDQQMLEWTQAGDGARLMMLVLHDDGQREYAYGPAKGLPDTHVGTFSEALLTQANKSGWIVISMKDDWKRIYPFDK
ncbi:MAG TPA: HAD family hydrolase [Terrimicrobiaceae bacterium]|jgi:phosphoglycolate phosphatase-like HAD superfamily hydrolase|nr:HAD family hydrolase [Terrimicrobiaceae bacterium]